MWRSMHVSNLQLIMDSLNAYDLRVGLPLTTGSLNQPLRKGKEVLGSEPYERRGVINHEIPSL